MDRASNVQLFVLLESFASEVDDGEEIDWSSFKGASLDDNDWNMLRNHLSTKEIEELNKNVNHREKRDVSNEDRQRMDSQHISMAVGGTDLH